jgi:23S rRNA (cytosine1962-C5)-methyltransferase
MYPRLILKKGSERRQLMGHPWVYDGEVVRVEGQPADGDVADCTSFNGTFLGRGYFNSRSKIRLRVLTRQASQEVDDDLLLERLSRALHRRRQLYPEAGSLRLIHAEGDGLPGLTVDRYEDVLVIQCTSLGMDRRQDVLSTMLSELTGINKIYLRNDLSTRRNDGLTPHSGFLAEPFATSLQIRECGLTFEIDVATGHKTGFYLDQMDNHQALYAYVSPACTVLDAFCYCGAFAVHAAVAGAGRVLALDSSPAALELATRNAELNGVQTTCRFEERNVFDSLRQMVAAREQFDLIILDPPSFTHNRKAVPKALNGYKEINLRALRLLRAGGILMTFTCSYYVDRQRFEGMLNEAAADAHRQLIVRQRLSQAVHHSEALAIPETRYLKGIVVEAW